MPAKGDRGNLAGRVLASLINLWRCRRPLATSRVICSTQFGCDSRWHIRQIGCHQFAIGVEQIGFVACSAQIVGENVVRDAESPLSSLGFKDL